MNLYLYQSINLLADRVKRETDCYSERSEHDIGYKYTERPPTVPYTA